MSMIMDGNKVLPSVAYKVPGWNIETNGQYDLDILITPGQFVYSINDIATREVKNLQSFQFNKVFTEHDWIFSIEAVLENQFLLKQSFRKRRVGIFSPAFTLVPGFIYEDASAEELLTFNAGVKPSESVLIDDLVHQKIRLIYSLPKDLVSKFSGFRDTEIHHSMKGLLEFLINEKTAQQSNFTVYVQSNSFQVIYVRDKVLRFCNSFAYSSQEDFLYYFLFICNQLHLDPEKLRVMIMGEILQDSALFHLINKYVRHIAFYGAHPGREFAAEYPLPGHFFFNLFCL